MPQDRILRKLQAVCSRFSYYRANSLQRWHWVSSLRLRDCLKLTLELPTAFCLYTSLLLLAGSRSTKNSGSGVLSILYMIFAALSTLNPSLLISSFKWSKTYKPSSTIQLNWSLYIPSLFITIALILISYDTQYDWYHIVHSHRVVLKQS